MGSPRESELMQFDYDCGRLGQLELAEAARSGL
jgi:hypothetical protein